MMLQAATDPSLINDNDQVRSPTHLKTSLCRREQCKYIDPSSKRVTLNVSGVRYETYEETLNHFPDTLLGCCEKRDQFYNHLTKEYTFPRSKCAFDSILFYYQSHGILARPDTVSIQDFDEELHFFEITNPDPVAEMFHEEELVETIAVATTFRQHMWNVLEYPQHSKLARIIGLFSLLVILFSVVIFCMETVKSLRSQQDGGLWFIMETVCVSWFITEYLCRIYSAPSRCKFICSTMGMVDLLAILPYMITVTFKEELDDVKSFLVMRALRLFRIARMFKLSRYSVGFKILLLTIIDSVEQMKTILFCTSITVLMFGSIVYVCEGNTGEFTSIPQSMWWAVQTMSSVGYGEIVPITPLGKFVGSVCAVCGILLFCLPTPILVANFLKQYTRALANSTDTLNMQQQKLVENMKRIYLSTNR